VYRNGGTLGAVKAPYAIVAVGVLVDGNIHGTDAGALVAMGARFLIPGEPDDADAVKEGKDGP